MPFTIVWVPFLVFTQSKHMPHMRLYGKTNGPTILGNGAILEVPFEVENFLGTKTPFAIVTVPFWVFTLLLM